MICGCVACGKGRRGGDVTDNVHSHRDNGNSVRALRVVRCDADERDTDCGRRGSDTDGAKRPVARSPASSGVSAPQGRRGQRGRGEEQYSQVCDKSDEDNTSAKAA